MSHAGHRDRYKAGDYLADCHICGFTYYASQLRKRWDGYMVCDSDFEERHPSDLQQAPRAERPIPWSSPPQDVTIDVPGWTEAVVDGSAKTVTFGPVDPDAL
jgi:hypothetical protein